MKNFLLLLPIAILYGCGEVATTEKKSSETDYALITESSENEPAQSTIQILVVVYNV
ncbi:hypothetical protein H9Q13_17750 [Pontibacter sp. JH31]|uniref:Uncharacterized protein n=1 Tax=Pontibacter aquaedesilientis TaxID=2766980 RepID=A0ABR7XL60_9BACT|nr:hypothetical protein [Pontibacter aquaedesilientis]MBD1399018.1 hypothetical protein [Pontibacter aquaedesilientis]